MGHKLFVWGGDGGSPGIQTTTIESFDVTSEAWDPPRQLSCSLPNGLYGMAVTTDGESAFFFGGVTLNSRVPSSKPASERFTYSNTLYQVNLSTLQCKELVPKTPSHAPKGVSGGGMVCFNHRLVLYGGYTGRERVDKVYVFDIRTSEWGEETEG